MESLASEGEGSGLNDCEDDSSAVYGSEPVNVIESDDSSDSIIFVCQINKGN